jgi:hypothetical protein
MKKEEIIYFRKPGPGNTEALITAVKERVIEQKVTHVVVASTRGGTALQFHKALKDIEVQLVCVGEHAGFPGGDKQLLPDKTREELQEKGVPVLICSHALSGISRSVSKKFGGVSSVEIIANVLRQFGGEGVKVAVEIAVMAADAGLIPTDREVIAVAGTKGGSDTAIVLRAAHMNNFFDLEIREIIAKPRQR